MPTSPRSPALAASAAELVADSDRPVVGRSHSPQLTARPPRAVRRTPAAARGPGSDARLSARRWLDPYVIYIQPFMSYVKSIHSLQNRPPATSSNLPDMLCIS